LCPSLNASMAISLCLYLIGDTFVARMDSKADRKQRILIIHNLHFEPIKLTKSIVGKVCDAVKNFAEFNHCDAIIIQKSNDKSLLKIVRGAIAN